MAALGTVPSVFSVLGACWFGACSFPDYRVDESQSDPSPARICADHRTSDAETGIDCGGGCPPCAMGEPCRVSADCASGACVHQVCQAPTCDDRVKNATEADVDCGGNCAPCPPGRDCQTAIDCEEHICASASNDCDEADCGPLFCQVPTCTDLVQNGTETGLDCGSKCDPCGNGMGCLVDGDCVSGHCTEGVCVAPRCTDGMQNGTESDKDCGGMECARCGPGKVCREGSDCASRVCEVGSCAKDGCDDTVKNRDESDVDCGGKTCDGCAELFHCVGGTDCASGMCLTGLCVPAMKTGETLSREGWHASASNRVARYFKIVLRQAKDKWWSINEINVRK